MGCGLFWIRQPKTPIVTLAQNAITFTERTASEAVGLFLQQEERHGEWKPENDVAPSSESRKRFIETYTYCAIKTFASHAPNPFRRLGEAAEVLYVRAHEQVIVDTQLADLIRRYPEDQTSIQREILARLFSDLFARTIDADSKALGLAGMNFAMCFRYMEQLWRAVP